MPTVVSNTSPILNLAIVDRLPLLQEQFPRVIIPSEVLEELKPGDDFPGSERIRQALDAQWLVVMSLQSRHLKEALMLDLDQGEAAAIALALELGSKQILMDEFDGRAKAKALGFEPLGILGILLRAKRRGMIASLKVEMEALRRDAGFFIAARLFEEILHQAGE